MSEEKYVIVTTISSFRHRYCVPVSELQKLNQDHPVEPETWAKDSVTMEEVKEFSQHHIGETIIDSTVLSEEEMLALFDKDNDYLKNWSKEQKISYAHRWKEDT
jgi:hypothetical protein